MKKKYGEKSKQEIKTMLLCYTIYIEVKGLLLVVANGVSGYIIY